MEKKLFLFIVLFLSIFLFGNEAKANDINKIILDDSTEHEDVYPAMQMIKDRERKFTIEDVTSAPLSESFVPSEEIMQEPGFFETGNWIRFEVENKSNERDWLLEFAFPIIYEIELYTKIDDEVVLLFSGGAIDHSFRERDITHRNFVFNIEIEQGQSQVFYAMASGGADLHPPIIIWDKDRFIEKTENEFLLLGIFYGIILVMILYNLFLFFSLRLKSYLYYVLVIFFTLMGKLSINGIGFQYVWPNSPEWNIYAAPFWVALASIFILIFTRSFLTIDRYTASYKYISYVLIPLNSFVIVLLPFSHYAALHVMVVASIITFITVLIAASIALVRGARQARFYIAGWVIFLTGVSITILERAVVLPFSTFTEYAGQAALTIEVVLLSLALADKINMMRKEKDEAETKAQHSQKLAIQHLKNADELKDEFLAVTSHELRTPLYGIIGIAETLRDGIAGDVSREMKEQLSMIITSGQRLTYLVNEILDLSKMKYDSLTLDLKPVDLNGMFDIVLAVSKPLLKNKNIQLIKKIDPLLPPVQADEHRLQQILHNLVDNAIKYTDEGEIVISAERNEEKMVIKVSDTGHGISEDQLQLIFEPFQQGEISLSREIGGIGIGLNITKRLVDLHDGTIEVESTVGKGSVFTVTLPVYKEAEQALDVASPDISINIPVSNEEERLLHQDPTPKQKKNTTVLVVDDEVVNLQVLMNQLSLNGYDVLTASSGDEVFQLVDKNDLDLVILDIMMPGMSGYEVCQKLRNKYSLMELPILMLTAKNQSQDKIASFEAGANDYLVKPCDKQELLSRVKTLVRVKRLNEELVQLNLLLEDKVSERTSELNIANDNLQQMAHSRRQLLANIAHELGTPLTLIHNYIQSVQKGLIRTDDTYYRKLVLDKINVLNRLIDDLFDLSKLELGKISLDLHEFDLREWLEQVYDTCEFAVSQENRQFIRYPLPSHLKGLSCFIDEERCDQLFSNLISNAIKNTPEKSGTITMRANVLENDKVVIQVEDNGSGIKKEELPYIFDRFYRKSSSIKDEFGTGLGLAIAKQIVESHRGEINVESEFGEGTVFSIILPVTEKQ